MESGHLGRILWPYSLRGDARPIESKYSMNLLSLALLIQQPVPVTTNSFAETCTPQPMPRAIDISAIELSSQKIEFAATPSLESPRGAWVVRLWRRGTVEANIEILQLRGQIDCNRYNIIKVWKSVITQDEYAAIATRVVTFGVPDQSMFAPPYDSTGIISLDGTQIDLRLENSDWRVDHRTNLIGGLTIVQTFTTVGTPKHYQKFFKT